MSRSFRTATLSRRTRRVLVVVTYTLWLIVFILGIAGRGVDWWGWVFVLFVLLGLFAGNVLRGTGGQLDERQKLLEMKAQAITYRVVAVLMLIPALIHNFSTLPSPMFTFFFAASVNVLYLLPSGIVVWLEPDPVAGDDPAAELETAR